MERRSRDRIDTDLPATCRVPATPHSARVLDISRGGCRVNLKNAYAEPGVSISLDLGQGVQARGTIVWVRGDEAGVRFNPGLGMAAAVALGLEDAPPVTEPVWEPVDERNRGILHHWFRKLTGGLAKSPRKATVFFR